MTETTMPRPCAGRRPFISIALAALLTLASGQSVAGVAQPRDTGPAETWKVITVTQESGGERQHRGFMLFMADADGPGAAFRCENGRLYAYLSTRAVDFEERLQDRFANPRNREVSYRFDSGLEGTEIWVQMYGGRVYLVTERATTLGLFRAAADGDRIAFTRKHKDPLAIALPPIGAAAAESFLGDCELRTAYHPVRAASAEG